MEEENAQFHIEQVMQVLHDYLEGRAVEGLFNLGEAFATPAVLEAVYEEKGGKVAVAPKDKLPSFFTRHECGDWGDLSQEDQQANERALKEGGRIQSVYTLKNTGQKLWVVTEADRSKTTLMIADEYQTALANQDGQNKDRHFYQKTKLDDESDE